MSEQKPLFTLIRRYPMHLHWEPQKDFYHLARYTWKCPNCRNELHEDAEQENEAQEAEIRDDPWCFYCRKKAGILPSEAA
jgi:hypothetical protein